MSNIPFWFSPPPEPTRRFLQWFALVLLVVSTGFTVGFGVLGTTGFLVVSGLFVLVSLGLVTYAWRFAPADLGRRERDPMVRSGSGTPRPRDLTDV
jgi:hypothetical protein